MRPFLSLTIPWSTPATRPLSGHHGTDTLNWYNTDLYVSTRNPDGTYGMPRNLGSLVNTDHLECCPWLNDEQTVLVFTREGIGNSSETGTFVSRRPSRDAPWGAPERLPGDLGAYLNSEGIHDLHVGPSGDVYGWSESQGGKLYGAPGDGAPTRRWGAPSVLELSYASDRSESQPWLNDAETRLYFNRWGEDGDRELCVAERPHRRAPWGRPRSLRLLGFADGAGRMIWGEPSFTRDGALYFVRFDTGREGWPAAFFRAPRNRDGSYGPPARVRFRF